MALPVYLAMTAAELAQCEKIPPRTAWMACHFSSYGTGLSNLPRQLPEGSLLIVNDRIPMNAHDPGVIAEQLTDLVQAFSVSAILLDFQRDGRESIQSMVQAITQALPCPVAVTERYARDVSCAVFLEAPRAYHPLKERVKPWAGRELWLEASYSPGTVIVTEEGSAYHPDTDFPDDLPLLQDAALHCVYAIERSQRQVQYHFKRTQDDLMALLEEAETLGITRAVGLYQELGEAFSPQ